MSTTGVRSETELREAMSDEAKRIEDWSRTWDFNYRMSARSWFRWNYGLVGLGTAAAAAAGATGLGGVWGTTGPGLLALAAAVASGLAGSLRTSHQASEFNTAAAANSGLADDARVFRVTVVEFQPIGEVEKAFEALCKRRDTTVSGAPVSGRPKALTAEELKAVAPVAQKARVVPQSWRR
jgi:hypothetical protein